MANHKSAKTRIRRNATRADINSIRRNRVRTFIKNVEKAIAGGDKAQAAEAFKLAEPEIMRSAGKGIVRKKTASRKISRLSVGIKAL